LLRDPFGDLAALLQVAWIKHRYCARESGWPLRHLKALRLVRLVPERPYFPIKLPKLDGVTVDQLFGAVFGRFVIIAEDVNGPQEMPVITNNVHAILSHWPGPHRGRILLHSKYQKI
jgi:hypothetical protein